jgi:hypothetical protein
MYKQEIAARPRNRNIITLQELAKETFSKLQENDPNGIPIVEVLDVLSIKDKPGHITYKTLINKAQAGTLLAFDEKGRTDGSLQNLSSAYAEAIVLKELRNNTGLNGSAIFDPAVQAKHATDQGSSNPLSIINIPSQIGSAILKSFENKTPDILFTVPRIVTREGTEGKITYGTWNNVIDPNNPTNTKKLLKYSFVDQSLVSPIEVTVSGDSTDINRKIKKFEDGYINPFKRVKEIAYVPVLVLDYEKYKNISDREKLKMVNRMRLIGGFISVVPGLQKAADARAIAAAEQLTSVMQSRKKDLSKDDQQESQNLATTKEMYFAENSKAENTSLFNKVFQEAKAGFKKLQEKLSFSSEKSSSRINSNLEILPTQKLSEETTIKNNAASKNHNASEIYQKLVSATQSIAPQLKKVGMDVINNSDYLNIMIAVKATSLGLDTEQILKQSPTYLAKGSPMGDLWAMVMVNNVQNLIKENSFSSPVAKEILKSYNNTKTNLQTDQQKSVNEFDRYATAVKSSAIDMQVMNLDVLHNPKHLHIAIAAVALSSGKDAKEILRQSPDYVSATPEKGEALLSNWISKAESVLEPAKPASEVTSQRGGYER